MRQKLFSWAGPERLGLQPRPGALSPPVRLSESGRGGRGRRRGCGAAGAGRAGLTRPAAPAGLHRAPAPARGAWGGARSRRWGSAGPPTPESLPRSAGRRPPDNAHKQGGAAATGTRAFGAPSQGHPLQRLLLPRRPRLPSPSLAPATQGPQSRQQRASADGCRRWNAHCACSQSLPGKEAGISLLLLASGVEWQRPFPAPSGSKLRNRGSSKTAREVFFEAWRVDGERLILRVKNKRREWRAAVFFIRWCRPP